MRKIKSVKLLKDLPGVKAGEIEDVGRNKKEEENLCKCGEEGTIELHICPYDQDINDCNEPNCNCCPDCIQECCNDI